VGMTRMGRLFFYSIFFLDFWGYYHLFFCLWFGLEFKLAKEEKHTYDTKKVWK